MHNPKIKEGDNEVEDVNGDSDIDTEEKKTSQAMNRNEYSSYKKKNMDELNNKQVLKVPKSLSVNNKNHCKGPNIFLLRDRICARSKYSLNS